MTRCWPLVLLMVCACSKPDGRGSQLDAKLDGETFAVNTVLASSLGGEAIRLEFSKEPIDCATLKPALENHDKRVTVTLAPQLQPDGSQRWGVADTRTPKHGGVAPGSMVTVHEAKPTRELRAEIDIHTQRMLPFGDDPKGPPKFEPALDLNGLVHAKGCGELPVYVGDIPAEEQKDLSVVLGGKRFAMRGATLVEMASMTTLLVSTLPHPCSIGVLGADLTISIPVNDPLTAGASIHGYLLASAAQMKKSDVTLAKKGDAFDVSADVKLVTGHTFKMSGTIRPKRCSVGKPQP